MKPLLVFWSGCAAALALALGLCVTAAPKAQTSARVLIVTGIDYPGHHWRETGPALKSILEQDPRLKVTIAENPGVLATVRTNDWDLVLLHFMNWEVPAPGVSAQDALRQFVAAGRGLMLVHFACGAWQDWPEFRNLAGRVWDPKLRPHDPHGPFTVEISDPKHPSAAGLQAFQTTDELYTCLTGNAPIQIVASATSQVDGQRYPMAFVLDYGKGHVFHTVLGHDVGALTNSAVPQLLRQGCAWAAGLNSVAEGR